MFEIEYKYFIPESYLAELKEKIGTFTFLKEVVECDTHGYANDHSYIRIRETRIAGFPPLYDMIYKDRIPRSQKDGTWKELTVGIHPGDAITAAELVASVCVELLPPVQKTRRYYSVGDITLTLDQVVGLGTFVELGILSSQAKTPVSLEQIARAMGFREEWRVCKTYGELLKQKLEEG